MNIVTHRKLYTKAIFRSYGVRIVSRAQIFSDGLATVAN